MEAALAWLTTPTIYLRHGDNAGLGDGALLGPTERTTPMTMNMIATTKQRAEMADARKDFVALARITMLAKGKLMDARAHTLTSMAKIANRYVEDGDTKPH